MIRTLLTAIFLSLVNKAVWATITTYETGEALLAEGKSFGPYSDKHKQSL